MGTTPLMNGQKMASSMDNSGAGAGRAAGRR